MAAPKILCDTAGMDRKTWLAVRAHGPDGSIPITIGGSDVAAIFGISPWKTPLDLWLEKSGKLLPNESENIWQKEMGHLLEPVVAQMYAFRTGHRVIPDTYLYQHALYPWALANVDYSMEDKDTKEAGGLECKTTTYHNADEWTDDKVPMHYEYQCRFYMGVRDLPFWDIACMWGNGEKDFPIRRIYRDFAIEEMIFETIAAFIQSIHNNQPPSMADVAPALAMKSLARIYAAGTLAAPTIEFGRKHERPIRRIAALQQICEILAGQNTVLDCEIQKAIRREVEKYATDMLNKLRELQVDLRTNPAIFVGGGSILLRAFIKASAFVRAVEFEPDTRANAYGYELLGQAQLEKLARRAGSAI